MTKHPLWSDEYWPLLLQLYMAAPEGVKPMYSRGLVNLGLELHIPPRHLYALMFSLRRCDTPSLSRLREKYVNNPKRLARRVKAVRAMSGFCSSGAFYEGVETNETFEQDFRPLSACPSLKPAALIMALDLYFRLTPVTMVRDTPEIVELAKLTGVRPAVMAEVMAAFRVCDPYLKGYDRIDSVLLEPCREVWRRYGNGNPEELSALAAQLRYYFL